MGLRERGWGARLWVPGYPVLLGVMGLCGLVGTVYMLAGGLCGEGSADLPWGDCRAWWVDRSGGFSDRSRLADRRLRPGAGGAQGDEAAPRDQERGGWMRGQEGR